MLYIAVSLRIYDANLSTTTEYFVVTEDGQKEKIRIETIEVKQWCDDNAASLVEVFRQAVAKPHAALASVHQVLGEC